MVLPLRLLSEFGNLLFLLSVKVVNELVAFLDDYPQVSLWLSRRLICCSKSFFRHEFSLFS